MQINVPLVLGVRVTKHLINVVRLNESRSIHIDFINKKIRQPIFINSIQVPYANTAKYLGMTLDAKLRWKDHIKKGYELNIRFRKMYWLLGRNSELSVHNKLTLCKQVIVQFGVVVSSSGAHSSV
jgi:hypothetical protein